MMPISTEKSDVTQVVPQKSWRNFFKFVLISSTLPGFLAFGTLVIATLTFSPFFPKSWTTARILLVLLVLFAVGMVVAIVSVTRAALKKIPSPTSTASATKSNLSFLGILGMTALIGIALYIVLIFILQLQNGISDSFRDGMIRDWLAS